MNIPDLDSILCSKFTKPDIRRIFNELKIKKTDMLSGIVKIAHGVDYCTHEDFEHRFDACAQLICEKGSRGKYCFTAFREIETPKPPFTQSQLEQAREAKKIRILSIATIRDTIFQTLIMESLYAYVESVFCKEVDRNCFAYRKNKSSKMAVHEIRKAVNKGYVHVLDGDIKKFFDEINHEKLIQKLDILLGNNSLIENYLYRFIRTRKLPPNTKNKQKNYEERNKGIPQGGVLSGLLANIFLLDFDRYVINDLSKHCDFKYFRYADDFVLLFKRDKHITTIYEYIKQFLSNEGLTLHPIGTKTKVLNLDPIVKNKLDFLGFEISPKNLKIKKSNVNKFIARITQQINKAPTTSPQIYLESVIFRIRPKIVGIEDKLASLVFCPECSKYVPKRNWTSYFLPITDVRQLRAIDIKIRFIIHNTYFQKTKKILIRNDYKNITFSLISLERTYYKYKKIERKSKKDYCNCIRRYDHQTKSIVILNRTQSKSNPPSHLTKTPSLAIIGKNQKTQESR